MAEKPFENHDHETRGGIKYDDRFLYKTSYGGTSSVGMKRDGYLDMAHPYLKSLDSEVLFYGVQAGDPANEPKIYCVVRATATAEVPDENGQMRTIKMSALGDGNSREPLRKGQMKSRMQPHNVVRMVEARAKSRVLKDLLNITSLDLDPHAKVATDLPVDEDDFGDYDEQPQGEESRPVSLGTKKDEPAVEKPKPEKPKPEKRPTVKKEGNKKEERDGDDW